MAFAQGWHSSSQSNKKKKKKLRLLFTLCSLPGSSVHGIFQARILEWVVISFSRRSSWPRDQTCVSCIAGRFFITEPPRISPKVEETKRQERKRKMTQSKWQTFHKEKMEKRTLKKTVQNESKWVSIGHSFCIPHTPRNSTVTFQTKGKEKLSQAPTH